MYHHQILKTLFNLDSPLLKGTHPTSLVGQVVAFRESPEFVTPNPHRHLAHFEEDLPVAGTELFCTLLSHGGAVAHEANGMRPFQGPARGSISVWALLYVFIKFTKLRYLTPTS